MKENLTFQYTEYGRIIDRVNNQFDKYGEIPDEAPVTSIVLPLKEKGLYIYFLSIILLNKSLIV